jgi:hypothetical protein
MMKMNLQRKRRRKMTTPVLEGREVIGCTVCGLRLNPGSDGHKEDIDCINALRMANKMQSEVNARSQLALSTRFFAIMEELVHDPDCGVQYYTHNEETGEKTHLGYSTVVGVMAAIFGKFQQMGDWSPQENLKKELKDEQVLNLRMQELLIEVEQLDGKEIPRSLELAIESFLHPDRPVEILPDQDGS